MEMIQLKKRKKNVVVNDFFERNLPEINLKIFLSFNIYIINYFDNNYIFLNL